MALPEESKPSNTKNTSQKPERKEKPFTKVVIRRLPPCMEKNEFLNQVSPVPNYDYFYLVNGEALLGENSFSRAYINFTNPNDVYDFKEKFDNYVFLDSRGHEYPAVVEFAAFQRTPKRRNKSRVDPKCGSIETDPYYLEFVENLKKPVELEDKPEYSYQFANQETKDTKTTPLLEFVKNRKMERLRVREERREERKRKELERKKLRDEERKKRYDEKSPSKPLRENAANESESKELVEKTDDKEVHEKSYYRQDYKYEDRKKDFKSRPPRKDFIEKREFKNKKEYYKEPNYGTYKKEETKFPKKIKKYSEKREERKLAEQKKAEEEKKAKEEKSEPTKETEPKTEKPVESNDKSGGDADNSKFENISEKEKKDNEERARERIRNKDRPTIAIYRPGMLSKRKQTDEEKEAEKK